MNSKQLIGFLQSNKFKKIGFFLGILFLILTVFISYKPEPFLKFGYVGVFIFNLFGPGTFLIPTLAQHMSVFWLALASSVGMSFNDSISWLIGSYGITVIPRSKRVIQIEKSLEKYGFLFLFFWSAMPIPYDLVGLITGYLGYPYKKFIVPSVIGKFTRFILLGYGISKIFKLN